MPSGVFRIRGWLIDEPRDELIDIYILFNSSKIKFTRLAAAVLDLSVNVKKIKCMSIALHNTMIAKLLRTVRQENFGDKITTNLNFHEFNQPS